MKRTLNIALTIASVAIGFSALAYNLVGTLAPGIVEVPRYSDLEARYYAGPPETSTEAILQGRFQSGCEAFLSDRIPARNQAAFLNAGLQRASIAASAKVLGFDVFPTFFDSHYYVVPDDGIIVDIAEQAPADGGGPELDAWISTVNGAAQRHPNVRFAYNCVARHDQVESNPTYRYFHNRLNPAWAQENLIDRLDPRIIAFVDAVESYDEICNDWIATEEHWKLRRALQSYDRLGERLGWKRYPYENPVVVAQGWYGDYARNGLDLDVPASLEDLPIDFSHLTFYELGDFGGTEKTMGVRDSVLAGTEAIEPGSVTVYYNYFGGGGAEVVNADEPDGKTALVVCDSLCYCLERFIASNYHRTTFLLPGNSRYDRSLESYIDEYAPDDVIIMTHVTKYQMFAEYSPAFIGL